MQRWRGLEAVPSGWGRCVATVGVYDGVHRGHQRLINHALVAARALDLPTVLVTFTPHPIEVIRPGTHPALLSTNVRKSELVEELGVDAILFVPFTREFSRLSPADFVHRALVEQLHSATVVIGENFRFGHRAAGDLAMLTELGQRWGFRAEAEPLLAEQGHPISSTFIRSSVEAGEVRSAAAVLGRLHRLDGVVIRGEQRGRELGYPTANLRTEQFAAIPADGVYAGRVVRLDERGNTRNDLPATMAAISVGTNPTFDGKHRTVESFLLDFSEDLYGQNLGVEFGHRLRGMDRFDTIDALVEQMADDVQQTRTLMTAP